METNEIDYKELARNARKELNDEFGRLNDRAERLKGYEALLDGFESQSAENRKLQEEVESLRQQLTAKDQQVAEEKERRQEVEMKLAEMTKLSAGMAKKSQEEDMIKVIRAYVIHSKQKRPEKRAKAKEAALDMVLANKTNLPEDLAAMIESLDDEQPDPKVVNVSGNYNDIHDNTTVNQK